MRRLYLVLFLICLPLGALAAPPDPALLKADVITYSNGARQIRARGHVEIVFRDLVLTASALTYDARTDSVVAEGPLRLSNGDTVTILADYAELSGDLQEGVLTSARMILQEQMQLAANVITRKGTAVTELDHVVASACIVTTENPTPFWQIRASRVTHDADEKTLRFQQAQLRLGSVPIFYLLNLRVPDPSVRRATGFLVPGFEALGRLGSQVYIPYFLTLGPYADLLLTPHIYSSGSVTLETRFRKAWANGHLQIDGAVSRDTLSPVALRGFGVVDGHWRLGRQTRLDLRIEAVSDDTVLSQNGLSDQTQTHSYARIERVARMQMVTARIDGFRLLSAPATNPTVPGLIGSAAYDLRLRPTALGGEIALRLSARGFQRGSVTDIVGRDGMRASAVADWSRQWISANGVVTTASAGLGADYYQIQQDSTYPNPITRGDARAVLDVRLPLARTTAQATHVIEPRMQLVWSEATAAAMPNDDALLVDYEMSSLFTTDRFSGRDVIETGLRANLGLAYSLRALSGWRLDLEGGQVLRLADPGQFSAASGLSGTQSSSVLALRLAKNEQFRLVHRMVLGAGLAVQRSESRVALKSGRFDIDTSYLHFIQNNAGNSTAQRSQWLLESGVDLSRTWRGEANLRYDAATYQPSEMGLALTYSNDCIKIGLSLSRSFISSSNVASSTSFGFQVSLNGLGGRSQQKASGKTCAVF